MYAKILMFYIVKLKGKENIWLQFYYVHEQNVARDIQWESEITQNDYTKLMKTSPSLDDYCGSVLNGSTYITSCKPCAKSIIQKLNNMDIDFTLTYLPLKPNQQ